MRFILTLLASSLALMIFVGPVLADSADSTDANVRPPREQEWGFGMAVRSTNIAFDTEEGTVTTLIPLILFENKYQYLSRMPSRNQVQDEYGHPEGLSAEVPYV